MLTAATASKANLPLMRELNERIVLNLLRQHGTISRAELARQSNLSRSTISSIIADLLAAGLVCETGVGTSHGGRRPILIEFNYQSSYVLGLAVSGQQLSALLADLTGAVLHRRQRALDQATGPAEYLHQLAALVSDMLTEMRVAREKVLGIGMGLPSAQLAPTSLGGVPVVPSSQLRNRLSELTSLPAWFECDAYLGALAEQRWGAARGCANLAYLHLADSIGCGLILDGRLYRGALGAAGAIGHLAVDEHGPACYCGASGCLESLIGAQALLARARAQGLTCAHLADLADLAGQGHPLAAALVEQAGASLGSALASLLTIINPSRVVLGGDLAAAGEPLLYGLRKQLARRSLPAANQQTTIVRGTLGSDVIALGGAALVAQRAFTLEYQERGW